MKISIEPDQANKLYREFSSLEISQEEVFASKNINLFGEIVKTYLDINSIHQTSLKDKGYIEFSNLPVDKELCPPPSTASRPYQKGYISEMVLLGVTKACGVNPFAYQQEKKGALVHEITPIKEKGESISSEGVLKFDFHTDGAYLSRDIRPHTLSLMCLKDTEKTATNIVKLVDILENLDEGVTKLLTSPKYIHTAPETFKVKNKNIRSSILDLVDGQYEIKAALHSVQAEDKEADKALNILKSITSKNLFSKSWKRGDLVIFNNLKCMHGRGEIKGERWLQRCYGTYTFSPSTVLNLE
ncbi:TauD/TfdA family dioxygenase [Acinetobacter lactucae]|uniref:TauD/TfdA family dioxygenase n=1 Tax=Acinetobacter lactucae TaxID=1785128 RepID=UPI00237B19D8|nr:TauD/TfdA family dioxygenase [Acinetobacter lactucae]MDD9316041.1 TauD/TfdA family dioxygenase [Acinetobacter lactucae]